MSLRDIAKEVGCSHSGIDVMLKGQARGPRPVLWTPQIGHLTIDDREQILLGLNQGESMSSVARRLKFSPSTITREVKVMVALKDIVSGLLTNEPYKPQSGPRPKS